MTLLETPHPHMHSLASGVVDPATLSKWLGRKKSDPPLRPDAKLQAQLHHPAVLSEKQERQLNPPEVKEPYPRLGAFEVVFVLLHGERIVSSGLCGAAAAADHLPSRPPRAHAALCVLPLRYILLRAARSALRPPRSALHPSRARRLRPPLPAGSRRSC